MAVQAEDTKSTCGVSQKRDELNFNDKDDGSACSGWKDELYWLG